MKTENPTPTLRLHLRPRPRALPTPSHTLCRRCGCRAVFMIGLYRCDHPDRAARRCGGVLVKATP